MLLELLSKKARENLSQARVNELLNEDFIIDNEFLTATDKKKLMIIKETYQNYTVEQLKQETLNSTRKAADYLNRLIGEETQEILVAVYLDTKNSVIDFKKIFVGTLNSSVAHPREIFREAVKHPTARIIVSHNHPSGDTEPSEADIAFTQRLKESGSVLGIDVLDHIIVGQGNTYSFREADEYWEIPWKY